MRIFGYELEIKKAPKDKRVIIYPKMENGKFNTLSLDGNDWGFTERIDFKLHVYHWIEQLELNIPNMLAKDIVIILNIFAGEYCEFQLSKEPS